MNLFPLSFESLTTSSENVTLTLKNDTGKGKKVYITKHACVSNNLRVKIKFRY